MTRTLSTSYADSLLPTIFIENCISSSYTVVTGGALFHGRDVAGERFDVAALNFYVGTHYGNRNLHSQILVPEQTSSNAPIALEFHLNFPGMLFDQISN